MTRLHCSRMQPGVTDSGAVTGARVDQNNVTLDGLDVNDFATGGATQQQYGGQPESDGFGTGTIVGHAPVDSVEEFHGTVGGNLSSTGPSSGGQFQLVTKSGTNKFHGNLNEYHRDPSLVANTWFGNNSTPIVPRNHLIQNQFGGAIGGPIIIPKLFNGREKLFFFFDFNDNRVISSAIQQRTVPLDSLRNGIIGYNNASGGISSYSPAQIKAIDPAGIGNNDNLDYRLQLPAFPIPTIPSPGMASTPAATPSTPRTTISRRIMSARIDYNLNQNMKIFGRFTIVRENAAEYPNQFGGDPPTGPIMDQSYAFVVGHDWVIGSNKTNRVFAGETVQKLHFPNDFNPDWVNLLHLRGRRGQGRRRGSLFRLSESQLPGPPHPHSDGGGRLQLDKGQPHSAMGRNLQGHPGPRYDVADYNTTEIGLGGQNLRSLRSRPGPAAAAIPACAPPISIRTTRPTGTRRLPSCSAVLATCRATTTSTLPVLR